MTKQVPCGLCKHDSAARDVTLTSHPGRTPLAPPNRPSLSLPSHNPNPSLPCYFLPSDGTPGARAVPTVLPPALTSSRPILSITPARPWPGTHTPPHCVVWGWGEVIVLSKNENFLLHFRNLHSLLDHSSSALAPSILLPFPLSNFHPSLHPPHSPIFDPLDFCRFTLFAS